MSMTSTKSLAHTSPICHRHLNQRNRRNLIRRHRRRHLIQYRCNTLSQNKCSNRSTHNSFTSINNSSNINSCKQQPAMAGSDQYRQIRCDCPVRIYQYSVQVFLFNSELPISDRPRWINHNLLETFGMYKSLWLSSSMSHPSSVSDSSDGKSESLAAISGAGASQMSSVPSSRCWKSSTSSHVNQ
jgi:hypothetical protein